MAATAHAQTATPAVSTIVAFNVSNPTGNLVRGADGALYGVAAPATSVAAGLIYSATPDGGEREDAVPDRPPRTRYTPVPGLLLGSDGMLYGTTKFGRSTEANGTGTIYA